MAGKILTTRVHRLLSEALRRYTRFNADCQLRTAWTGLGSRTTYAPAVRAGYMELVPEEAYAPNGVSLWWRLTNSGAAIVAQWIAVGVTHADIEAGHLPSRNVNVALPVAEGARLHKVDLFVLPGGAK